MRLSIYLNVILNFIRFKTKKIIFGDSVDINNIQHISLFATIKMRGGNIKIGRSVSVRPGAYISCTNGGNIEIGDRTAINRNCIIASNKRIRIGCNCSLGPNICIYDHDHVYTSNGIVPGKFKNGEIIIEDGCWIGAGCIILRNTHIGKNCVIGAGTVVKGDIPQKSLVTSNRGVDICSLEIDKNE